MPDGERPPSSDQRGFPSQPSSLSELGARLDAVRRREQEEEQAKPRLKLETGAYGAAWRLSVEMVAGLIFGGGLGWLLDRWLGTSPLFLIVCFFLGAAAGITGAIRVARQMNARAEKGPDESDRS